MKILLNKENRIVAYAKVGSYENAIEVKEFKFEHPCDEYVLENGEIKYSPRPIDKQKLKEEYIKRINIIKAQILDEGYVWNGHHQKCREKDITFLANVIAVQEDYLKVTGQEYEYEWSFNDDDRDVPLSLNQAKNLRMIGAGFLAKVFKVEGILKKQEPHKITFEDYLKMVRGVGD